jgi:hypothetical protein
MSTESLYMSKEANEWGFVRMEIRIHLPHSVACRKRQLNGKGVWIRPENLRPSMRAGKA